MTRGARRDDFEGARRDKGHSRCYQAGDPENYAFVGSKTIVLLRAAHPGESRPFPAIPGWALVRAAPAGFGLPATIAIPAIGRTTAGIGCRALRR